MKEAQLSLNSEVPPEAWTFFRQPIVKSDDIQFKHQHINKLTFCRTFFKQNMFIVILCVDNSQ